MHLAQQIATQFREVTLNGTWISTNFKTELAEVDYKMATTKIGSLNTIGDLTFHIHYYVAGVLQVFEGGSLDIRDKYSFDAPAIHSKEDWQDRVVIFCRDAEHFAKYVEKMEDGQLWEGFVQEEYGNYYRNIIGMIEHAYYHLGQVVLLKKLIQEM